MTDYNASLKGYIHIAIGLFDNKIIFGEDEHELHLGDALLQFVYTDLNLLLNRANYTSDDFIHVHPYFRLVDTSWRNAFIENLTSSEKSAFPTIKDLQSLQKSYLDLMTTLYNKNGTIDEKHIEEMMEGSELLSHNQCIYRMKLLKSGKVDYFLSTFDECLMLEFTEVLRRRILLKTCKNCGKIFAARRSNMDYCLRPYTADGRTCNEVGYTQTFAKNVKNDELLLAYTRAYKAHYARMTKPRKKSANLTREAFESWYLEAKHKLELARAGVLDAEEFKQWLKI